MTYGFLPRNWPAFQRQLRPTTPSGTMMDVVVTARSGDVHVFRQDEGNG